MAHSLKIKSIGTLYSQAANADIIDVEVEVYDGEKLLETRRFGYPLGTSKDDIVADLTKVKETLDADKGIAEETVTREAQMADVEAVKNALTDTQI